MVVDMQKKHIVIPLFLTLILLLTITPSAYASSLAEPQEFHIAGSDSGSKISAAPNNRPLSSLEEVVEWHNAPWVWNEFPVLAKDIIVNRPITLSQTAKEKVLGAMAHTIRVTAGGSLTLNNSNLIIQGPRTVIIVESGGLLLLQKGAISTTPGAAIVVEKGGRLTRSVDFLVDGGKILDKNDENEPPTEPDSNLPPTKPEESPDPPPVTTLPAILNTSGIDDSLSCLQGEPPASSDYPSKEWVYYNISDNIPVRKELPVRWELDTVDFHTAGTYAVKGIFTAEVLAEYGLSNPNNLYATLQLTVLKPSPLDTLTGNVLSVGSEGRCLIQLALPPLPEGATALYIHRSADGKNWQKAVREIYINGNIPSSEDNFLPYAVITPKNLYVPYYYQTDYRPIWLRVEVVGSAVSGISNEIKLEMPAGAKPGDSIHTGQAGDNGAFDGNRGGGGQSEGDRELPNVPDKPSEDKTLTPDNEYPTYPTLEQIPSETVAQRVYVLGEISKGEPGVYKAAQDRISEGSPVSIPSDAEHQKVTVSSPLTEQETEPAILEAQALSAEEQIDSPPQKSRGVLLTLVATAFAADGLLLFRKSYKNRKKKP